MRIESSVVSVSWIPSEAIKGVTKLPFEVGVAHYDETPPDVIDGRHVIEKLLAADRIRFANVLTAWIEVEDGRVVDHGQGGESFINTTTVRLGKRVRFTPTAFPTIEHEPEVGDGWVRFAQTAGGRTGAPAPRHVNHPPYVQFSAPTAWTTLQLTLHADGRVEHGLAGASAFPRHWIYDANGTLCLKSGLIDFEHWYRNSFGEHSPWGDEDSPAVVSQVETALERELSHLVMNSGAKPALRKIEAGAALTEQGAPGDELYLILDGVISVEVDGEAVAEFGPGSMHGERAILEGGVRTSTLRAVTPLRVAVATPDQIDREKLVQLSAGHRHEGTASE
ncbi:MAG TPA: cyclic nucleotide-binding domain-containing protein [Acidimicrobiales bacterium]